MLSETKSRLNGKTFLQTLILFLLVTQIGFAQWVPLGLEDKNIKDIAARNSTIFAVTSDSGSVYRSTDNGINWLQIIDSGAIDIAIAPSGTVFMVKDFPSQFTALLFSSSNNGEIWDTINVWEQLPPNPNLWLVSMNVSVSPVGIVYCGLFLSSVVHTIPNAIALSTDDGLTWGTPGWEIHAGALNDFRNQSVISAGTVGLLMKGELNEFKVKNLISEVNDGGGVDAIYLSADNGYSWSYLGSSPNGIQLYCTALRLCLNGNILLGSLGWADSGLFLSSDSCSSWTKVSSLIPKVGLSIESGGMLVGTDSLGVFLFSDDGDSLGSRNDGLTNLNIHSLTIDNNNYVYAGTDNGIWRRPLSEITSVDEEVIDEIPTEFLLSQNYPNPFNPSTKIKYSIPLVGTQHAVSVQIKVFDVLGNEIETLVNEEKTAGTYELKWNAEGLPSGVYFYQLKAGSFMETKKMILLK